MLSMSLGKLLHAPNPNIDPAVKKWLIHLENGSYGTSTDGILENIVRQLGETESRDRVHVQPVILSEASVGAVIPFNWFQTASHKIGLTGYSRF